MIGIKGMWINPGKVVALFPTPRYYSHWKASFRVTLDSSQPICLTFLNMVYQISRVMFDNCALYKKENIFSLLEVIFKTNAFDTGWALISLTNK